MRRILVLLSVLGLAVVASRAAVAQAPDMKGPAPAPSFTTESRGGLVSARPSRSRPAPKLPNIERVTRELLSAERSSVRRQLVASRNVLTFWGNHRWILAPNKTKCWEVPWQRSCTIARHSYRLHYTLKLEGEALLDRTDPVISRLNRGLSGTPMEGLGKTLRDIGRRFNVSPFFMAAAAGTESSFGFAGCGNNPKNVWGLAACDGRWHVPYFNSWDEAITFYANFLAGRWPSATSPYHFYGYAACDACWGRKTAMWMTSRFGVEPYTKYPRGV